MKLKLSTVSPSVGATSPKDPLPAHTLPHLYKALIQKLGLANLSRAMKRTLTIAGIVIVCLVIILIALPFLINVNRFRPKVESEASAALGRQVTVSNLRLFVLSGSVGAENIAIADDPGFGKSPFVTAKSLKVGFELMPLIFSKQLKVTDITLDAPEINLLKAANGKWNFSNIGSSAQKAPGSTPTNFSMAKLNVNHGKLSVGKANSATEPVIYDNVNISVKEFSFTSKFLFRLTAQLPASGDVNITGEAGPINPDDAARTPLTTMVKANGMNLVALGMIDPASGIAGLANFDGALDSDGSHAKAVGLFTGKQLKFSPKAAPAPKEVTIEHTVDVDLDKRSGTISQGDVAIGSATVHLTGTFHAQGEAEVLNLKLNAPNVPVDELEAMLPSMGVQLPSGSQLKGGTLSAELAIAGPLDKLVITGPVRLANTLLANFDLGSKLGALSAFAGKSVSSPNTSIQNASLNARVSPEGAQANDINLNVPALGAITGAGTVSPEGVLAFKMIADLQGGMVGGLSKVAGARSREGGTPFAIEGTTSNPKFIPDVGGAVAGVANGQPRNAAKGQVRGPTM